jgi:hypothetical protein
VITGYNTDVEYGGVTYHVQTEDKGLHTPVILSLVYTGGEILASKRSPYDDLVAQGFDQDVLTTRLQRQHKLICAAVHAGRIEDLRRMTERDSASPPVAGPKLPEPEPPPQAASDEPLIEDLGFAVRLIDEPELRGGQSATLQFLVTRAGTEVGGVPVVIRILGSTFSPQTTYATTDERGMAIVTVAFPDFVSGRAAVLVRAEDDGETAELRRVILPS